MNKAEARKNGLTARNALPLSVRTMKSRMIFEQLKPYIDQASIISCYISMRTEVDTYPVLQYCLDQKKILCVPVIRQRKLLFMTLEGLQDLHDAPFHTKEPKNGKIIKPEDIELMIVPLSSFDDEYNRTGYGKGYYDTILERVPHKIGIAFIEQKADHIDADQKDIPLDYVISA